MITVLYLVKGGKVVDRVNGAHVPELAKKTTAHSQTLAAPSPAPAPKEVSLLFYSAYLSCIVNLLFFYVIG